MVIVIGKRKEKIRERWARLCLWLWYSNDLTDRELQEDLSVDVRKIIDIIGPMTICGYKGKIDPSKLKIETRVNGNYDNPPLQRI